MDSESLILKIVDTSPIGMCVRFNAQHWSCWGVSKKAMQSPRFGERPN